MNPKQIPVSKRIVISLGTSLMLHTIIMIWSFFFIASLATERVKPESSVRVEIAKPSKVNETGQQGEAKKLPRETKEILKTETITPLTKPQERELVKREINFNPSAPQTVKVDASPQQNALVTERRGPTLSNQMRRSTKTKLVEFGTKPVLEASKGVSDVVGGLNIEEHFVQKDPGGTPYATTGLSNAAADKDASRLAQSLTLGGKGGHQQSGDLKDAIAYELYTYTDPADGAKYFKFSLQINEAARDLPSIPKEIVFLLDASQSIGDVRLAEYKEGLEAILKKLNPGDVFNLVVFKEDIKKLTEHSIAPTDKIIRKTVRYLEQFQAGGKTDAFEAFQKGVDLKTVHVPSYVMFLSDGRATQGVEDPRQLITEITRANNGKIGIFAFSGGLNVSRYLMDFLAYKNRGWSEHTDRDHLIGRDLSIMYDKIRHPVLLNLRYYVSGLNEQEMFPKILPDFFRNAEFTLYGKYDKENEFFFQLLGNMSGGKSREFIVQSSLAAGSPGGKDIASTWAFHKIYHLIGLLEYNKENAAVLKQIDELTEKFKIETPYSKHLR